MAYQTVSVQGGKYYQLAAMALKNSPDAQEVYLSVLWYPSGDGSGQNIGGDESTVRLTGDSSGFRPLTTGPVQAPPSAHSAKLRLMLRPRSAAAVTVHFDAVTFGETEPPPTTPTPPAETTEIARPESAPPAVEGVQRTPVPLANVRSPAEGPSSAPPVVEGAQRTPMPLANVRSPADEPSPAAGQGGGFNLALGPGLGFALGLVGLIVIWRAHRWWRSRAGGRSP